PLLLLILLYRYELRLVSRPTAATLLTLRLLVLVLVLSLVCLQPVYAREVRYEQPGRVLVLVDRSASMDLPDPQRSLADKIRLMQTLGRLPEKLPATLVEGWIRDLEQRREPTLLLPSEGENELLRAERWQQFRAACDQADRLTRSDIAHALLKGNGPNLLDALRQRHRLEVVGFDRTSREVGPDQLDKLFTPHSTADGTDLTAALIQAQRYERGEVLGIVLLSDGQHNSGPSPGKIARELGARGVPIFPIALGDVQPPPDTALLQVRAPASNLYKGVEGTIEVRVKITGLPAGQYPVSLHEEGNDAEIAPPQSIAHEGQDQIVDLRFAVSMDKVGTRTLTAKIGVPDGVKEAIVTNNQLSTTVRVVDDRVKLLLVDGNARWEFHYLATMLQRDRLVDLKTLLFEAPRLQESLRSEQLQRLGLPGNRWPGDEDALADFACIVLGDVDAERLPLEQRQRLERYVGESGGTLILVAGKKAMPLGFPATLPNGEPDPLAKLLPIEKPHLLAPVEGFTLSLTRAGQETRFLELDADPDDNTTLWAGHPRPWSWAVAGEPKPGATALVSWLDPADAKLPLTERERRHAVLARHNYGFGRVLFVGLDSTWRWRFRVGDLYHHRFWGQVVRWAASDRPLAVGNEWLRFGTPQPIVVPGEPVELTVRLAEKLGALPPNLLAAARVIALPNQPSEKEKSVALVPLSRPPARPRVLEATLRDLPPGSYAVELAIPELADKVQAEGKPLRLTFRVAPPQSKEMLRLETNTELLTDLASSSGGRLFAVHQADALRDLLTSRSRVTVERQPTKLYQGWWMLAVVATLLGLEWLIRKSAGLP
ncbi:MAG: hypothetical protein SNJ82_08880, partial [Gemmataceae bacterium]